MHLQIKPKTTYTISQIDEAVEADINRRHRTKLSDAESDKSNSRTQHNRSFRTRNYSATLDLCTDSTHVRRGGGFLYEVLRKARDSRTRAANASDANDVRLTTGVLSATRSTRAFQTANRCFSNFRHR